MAFSPSLTVKSSFFFSSRQPGYPPTHAIISGSSPPTRRTGTTVLPRLKITQSKATEVAVGSSSSAESRTFLVGAAASVGLALVILSMDGREAHALGPEGPLMEEFWDNMRRYGLYVLTVSTGAVSAIATPIFELLKNPITALLILVIAVGSGYLLSQNMNSFFNSRVLSRGDPAEAMEEMVESDGNPKTEIKLRIGC